MPTLIELGNAIQELESLLAEEHGDITDREEEIDRWLADLGAERDRKLDGYAAIITELEGRAEIRGKEATRLSRRAAVDQNKAKFLRSRLGYLFGRLGLKTVNTDRYRITLATNGGKTPIVLEAGPEFLPEHLQRVRTEVKPDLDAIRLELELEGPITGPEGEVIARFGERGKHMTIR